MADLSLSPNPAVMAVQGGLFIASFVSVKKLMVDPYLRVRSKREAQTSGNQDEAGRISEANAAKSADVEQRVSNAILEIKSKVKEIQKDSANQRQLLIDEATKASTEESEKLASEIKTHVSEAMNEIDKYVDSLASVCFERVTNQPG